MLKPITYSTVTTTDKIGSSGNFSASINNARRLYSLVLSQTSKISTRSYNKGKYTRKNNVDLKLEFLTVDGKEIY